MKRYALLLTLIFVCSLAPTQFETFDEPDSLSGSQTDIDASLASGRNNNPPTIDSIVLHNTEPLYFGQADPINMTVEASDIEDTNTEFFNYTWSYSGNELTGCGGSGDDGANCLLPILSSYVLDFPVSITVSDSEGASVSQEIMLFIWNNGVASATTDSGLSVSYALKYAAPDAFSLTATDADLSNYENVELPGYAGTYNAVGAVEYAPSTIYSASDILDDHSLNVSFAKSLGATSLWYVTDSGQWTMLSSNANEVDASIEQFSYVFPENSPVLPAGTLVLIGDSMSPVAPPDATISGLTAYQSSDSGDITSSWQVSGTYLSSDVIQVIICKDNLNCENAISASLAIGDVNFVYSGSYTINGSMYYITVEICNEASCSTPAQASVLVEKSSDSDTDGDGVNDGDDQFPNDANESVDSDGDGVGDNSDAFPQDGNETHDDDGDGVGNNSDAFPQDENETHDDDADGVGNNSDAFPQDGNETNDDDGDGVGDNSDAFPQDENETMDTDADGVGDNEDPEPENPDVSSPQDISVEISDSSSYIIAGSIVFLAIVILFVRRKQPPQPQINSHFVTDDSMWNDD